MPPVPSRRGPHPRRRGDHPTARDLSLLSATGLRSPRPVGVRCARCCWSSASCWSSGVPTPPPGSAHNRSRLGDCSRPPGCRRGRRSHQGAAVPPPAARRPLRPRHGRPRRTHPTGPAALARLRRRVRGPGAFPRPGRRDGGPGRGRQDRRTSHDRLRGPQQLPGAGGQTAHGVSRRGRWSPRGRHRDGGRHPVQLGGDVSLTVQNNTVRISPGVAGGQPLAFTLPLGDLPYGQQVSAVQGRTGRGAGRCHGYQCGAAGLTILTSSAWAVATREDTGDPAPVSGVTRAGPLRRQRNQPGRC